jgi:multidrug efflux pump subunit AcrA (membrane-fusion protein)
MTGVLSARLPRAKTDSTPEILVPYASVIGEAGETFVWVVDPEHFTVQKRPVVVGAPHGESVAIESGLDIGETIVSAGGHYLYDGARILAASQ